MLHVLTWPAETSGSGLTPSIHAQLHIGKPQVYDGGALPYLIDNLALNAAAGDCGQQWRIAANVLELQINTYNFPIKAKLLFDPIIFQVIATAYTSGRLFFKYDKFPKSFQSEFAQVVFPADEFPS